jgi:hypothetical protein
MVFKMMIVHVQDPVKKPMVFIRHPLNGEPQNAVEVDSMCTQLANCHPFVVMMLEERDWYAFVIDVMNRV